MSLKERYLPVISDERIDPQDIETKLIAEFQKVPEIEITSEPLDYGTGKIYHFLRTTSPRIRKGDRVVSCGAGVHSNEISAVFTWLLHGAEIFHYAHENGIKLIVYPLRNPSGLEKVQGYPDRSKEHRYNILDDRGNQGIGNNDFIRYKITGQEELVDDLGAKNEYLKWYWSIDIPGIHLPRETEEMARMIKRDLALGAKIAGVVDLHQDLITEASKGAYYYRMEDDKTPYLPILNQIENLGVPMIRNYHFIAGFASGKGETSDDTGGIVRYDGTWPDLMSKLGVKHCLTPETTGATPLDLAVKVNLIWIKGIIDLAAKE